MNLPDEKREAVVAAVAQEVTEHAAHMETYTLPALQPGFIDGWMHAMRLLTRDAGFIGSKSADALDTLLAGWLADAYERGVNDTFATDGALRRARAEGEARARARVEEFCADWERSADEDERYLDRAHASEIHDVYAAIRMNREHATALRAALDADAEESQ